MEMSTIYLKSKEDIKQFPLSDMLCSHSEVITRSVGINYWKENLQQMKNVQKRFISCSR